MMNEKIGILGGTFDPIHYGHLKIAEFCKKKLYLDKIIFIPAGSPPHKNPVEDYEHRAVMVHLAIKKNDDLILSEMEKPFKDNEKKYTYTYDTLNQVRIKYPNSKIYFIIGEDNVPEIKKWYRYEELLNLAQFVVLSRKGNKKYFEDIPYLDKLKFVEMPEIDISSEEIRKRIRKNEEIKALVPLKVCNYIKKNKLYRN